MKNRFFRVLQYRAIVGDSFPHERKDSSEATIKVEIIDSSGTTKVVLEAADSDGPIGALDKALRKALAGSFPAISRVRLVDYGVLKQKVDMGAESPVEVTISSTDEVKTWVTKKVSTNIIRASLEAMVESIEKELTHLSA